MGIFGLNKSAARRTRTEPAPRGGSLKGILLGVGFLSCLIGVEFLVVDKVELRAFSRRSATTTPATSASMDADAPAADRPAGRVVNLPDWPGYLFAATGCMCLLYGFAWGPRPDRPRND
jgi:hypothetical protein